MHPVHLEYLHGDLGGVAGWLSTPVHHRSPRTRSRLCAARARPETPPDTASDTYSDWLYRPRSEDELNPSLGERLTMRQGPVQVDIVRMMGGGRARSVKADRK